MKEREGIIGACAFMRLNTVKKLFLSMCCGCSLEASPGDAPLRHHTTTYLNLDLPENAVCLLHLLHLSKCTPRYFYHGSKHHEP